MPTLPLTIERDAAGAPLAALLDAAPDGTPGPWLLATADATSTPPTDGRPGRLGCDVLGSHALHLRLRDGSLDVDEPRPEGGWLLELERPGVEPFVELRAGSLHVRVLVDTASPTTLVDRSVAAAHPDAVVDGALAPSRVAGATFPALPVEVVDLTAARPGLGWPVTVVLGLSFLEHADWWLDLPANAWTLTRRPA